METEPFVKQGFSSHSIPYFYHMDERKSIWSALYRLKVHHLLVWVLYYAFFMTMYRGFYDSFLSLFLAVSLYFVFTAASFYFVGYYLFPKYLQTRQYGNLVLGILLSSVFFSLGLSTCIYLVVRGVAPAFASNKVVIFLIAFCSITTITGILCAGKLLVERIRGDIGSGKQERERVESELQYLKAQVNPHFLFNAINNIYFLIKKDPELAGNTLIKLSDLLRFQLYECTADKINIEKEIDYLQNFVALEKIRKGEKVKVEFEASPELQGFMLAPFLLIPFLENTFKYVSNSLATGNHIIIKMWRDGAVFHASFYNTTDRLDTALQGGIGHKNVMRRLELIYPGSHTLKIDQESGSYHVLLSLKLS